MRNVGKWNSSFRNKLKTKLQQRKRSCIHNRCTVIEREVNLIRFFPRHSKNFFRNKSMTRFYELTFRSLFFFRCFTKSHFNLNSWFPPLFSSSLDSVLSFYHSNISSQDEFMIGRWKRPKKTKRKRTNVKSQKRWNWVKFYLSQYSSTLHQQRRNSMGFVSIQFYIE